MSNRLFQGIVHQMRDSIDRVIGVVDSYAVTISCSDLTRIGETNEYLVLAATVTPTNRLEQEQNQIMRYL